MNLFTVCRRGYSIRVVVRLFSLVPDFFIGPLTQQLQFTWGHLRSWAPTGVQYWNPTMRYFIWFSLRDSKRYPVRYSTGILYGIHNVSYIGCLL